MEALLYIVLWVGFMWLMGGIGYGVAGIKPWNAPSKDDAGKDDGGQVVGISPENAIDPVCGRSIRTDRAKSNVHAGRVYYFCSRECREIFEAAPNLYVGNRDTDERGLGRSHA